MRFADVRVDPRVCGGAFVERVRYYIELGRSPRVRGSLLLVAAEASSERSIPACAGEPGTAGASLADTEVDPRVCGGAVGSAILCAV